MPQLSQTPMPQLQSQEQVGMRVTVATIADNRDFQTLYKRGMSIVGRFCVVYFRRRSALPGGHTIRLGITASKKVGNAVHRNRARRVIRAAFYQALTKVSIDNLVGTEIIIVARTAVADKSVKSYVIADFLSKNVFPKIVANTTPKKQCCTNAKRKPNTNHDDKKLYSKKIKNVDGKDAHNAVKK